MKRRNYKHLYKSKFTTDKSEQRMSNSIILYNEEYKKYQQKNLTQVEKDYLEQIKSIEQIAKNGE